MLGLIGKKVGMTQVFNAEGKLIPVTVIHVEPNVVLASKTKDEDGYDATVLCSFDVKSEKLVKPVRGQFEKRDVPAKRKVVEFRDFSGERKVGDSLGVEIMENVRYVDVVGVSKGKGFQGGMKRHGFGGGPASHGSKFHRGLGSTGMAATPSRVLKGQKMPGWMGAERVTVQNLEVVNVSSSGNVVLVKGAVPGASGCCVIVKESKKV